MSQSDKNDTIEAIDATLAAATGNTLIKRLLNGDLDKETASKMSREDAKNALLSVLDKNMSTDQIKSILRPLFQEHSKRQEILQKIDAGLDEQAINLIVNELF